TSSTSPSTVRWPLSAPATSTSKASGTRRRPTWSSTAAAPWPPGTSRSSPRRFSAPSPLTSRETRVSTPDLKGPPSNVGLTFSSSPGNYQVMDSFKSGALQIELRDPGRSGAVQLVWRGSSGERDPAKIVGPYLKEALGLAVELGVPLAMHFEEIDYFNSATV